jgi:ParB-like chromosome segregation protein Spo0J
MSTKKAKTMMMGEPVMRSRARLLEWDKNPRQGVYQGIAALMESLTAVGQQDAIHVWERPEGDYILKGHRRNEAMSRLVMNEGLKKWEQCLQVVHHFETEEQAYLFLLQDHGHTVALDAAEKVVATQTALSMGISSDQVAAAMGVTVDRVQLWFAFGNLPAAARRAMGDGELSSNTAEILIKVSKDKMAEAVSAVLRDEATGTAMSHGQAKAFLESKYLLPAKWEIEWRELEPRLKKKLTVMDGHQYVEWESRSDFVLGESGHPDGQYEFADAFMRNGKQWGVRAKELGVPVFVVPAPRNKDGYVLLVSSKMIAAAESVVPELPRNGEEQERETEADQERETEGQGDEENNDDREWVPKLTMNGPAVKRLMGQIAEALSANPAKGMTCGVAELALPHLVREAHGTRVLWAWLGEMAPMDLLIHVDEDKKGRGQIRWALLLLWCVICEGVEDPEAVLVKLAEEMGVQL